MTKSFQLSDSFESSVSPQWLGYYRLLLSIRPAQIGSVAKTVLGVRRRVVRSSTGALYCIDPVSVFGLELLSQGQFEPALTKVVQVLLRPGDVFVDVGGNEGYFSILAARRVENGSVLCVEPQSRLVPTIQRNISLNCAQVVSIENVALSDKNGEAELYLRPSSNTGASSFYKHWRFGSTSELVATKRLDDLLHDRGVQSVRLVKIDCEGAESLVLEGAIQTVRDQIVDFYVIDYHTHIAGLESCDRAHAALAGAGYRLTKYYGLCIYVKPGEEKEMEVLATPRFLTSWRD